MAETQHDGPSRREVLQALIAAGASALVPHLACGGAQGEHPTVFSSYDDLARLPFFTRDAQSGLLRATVELPPAVDVHTHLGISVLVAEEIDLLQRTARTDYIIGCSADQDPPCRYDLEDYINGLATQPVLERASREVVRMGIGGSEIAASHTIANLLAELDALGFARAAVLPIALGLARRDDLTERWHAAIEASGNAGRLLCFASVHPGDAQAVDKVRTYHGMGLHGLKIHPPMQRVYADDPALQPIYAECQRLSLPVFFHTGRTGLELDATRPYAEVAHYAQPLSDYPGLRFVFGHSGARDFDQALALAQQHDNVWLDAHGQGLSNLRRLIDGVGAERVFFGSDWPWYPIAASLAKILIVTEGDQTVRDLILAENARTFFG